MTLPKPPISADVDLRDFRFMPLDVVRLKGSELALTVSDEGFRAAVMLWCAAWHQVPAGSLPNDDRALARLAGCDADAMHRIRDEALHGFVLCSDGKLYHSVIVEKANEAWSAKERYRKAARKRWKGKKKTKNATHGKRIDDLPKTDPKISNIGTGTGTGTIKESMSLPLEDVVEAEFPRWYDAFPRHVAREAALRAYRKARKKTSAEVLLAGAQRYAALVATKDQEYVKHPATWLNGGCWADDAPAQPSNGSAAPTNGQPMRYRDKRALETGWPAWVMYADEPLPPGKTPADRTAARETWCREHKHPVERMREKFPDEPKSAAEMVAD